MSVYPANPACFPSLAALLALHAVVLCPQTCRAVFQGVLAQKDPKWLYHLCMRRFKRVGQEGPLTRLMACTKEELEAYTPLDVVDTYVAPSFAKDSAHSDDYPPYNKPGAVTHWLRVSHLHAQSLPCILVPLAACGCSVRLQTWL